MCGTRKVKFRPLLLGQVVALIACLWLLALPANANGRLLAVPDAPPLTLGLKDLEGMEWSLDRLRGKVVLVNFWASWCPSCLAEIPSMQRLDDAMPNARFQVIAVNVGEPRLRVQRLARSLGMRFPVLLDRESAVFDRWGAKVLPTTYVLDRDGIARFIARGPLEWDDPEVIERLRSLIADRPAVSQDRKASG